MPFLLLAFVLARTSPDIKLFDLTNEHWGRPALIPVVQVPAPWSLLNRLRPYLQYVFDSTILSGLANSGSLVIPWPLWALSHNMYLFHEATSQSKAALCLKLSHSLNI